MVVGFSSDEVLIGDMVVVFSGLLIEGVVLAGGPLVVPSVVADGFAFS